MTISHFGAVLLFSLFTSIIFGITQRSDPRMMIRFGAFCFVTLRWWYDCSQLADVAHQTLAPVLHKSTIPSKEPQQCRLRAVLTHW